MRLATILEAAGHTAAVLDEPGVLPLAGPDGGPWTMRQLAAGGEPALALVRGQVRAAHPADWLPLDGVRLGPAVPDPGAIYTIGHNYAVPGEAHGSAPDRPLVFGKAAASTGAPGGTLAWDRGVTDDVDAECELGVVVGSRGSVFGWTIINDVSARDPRLDGDQWLLGKSMPGFCPVGPWIVTPDALDARDLGIGCRIDGIAIQDGRTSAMRFGVEEILAWLGRHLELRPGDLVATGTPARLTTPPGPERRLRAGDTVTCWIEGIGELTTTIA